MATAASSALGGGGECLLLSAKLLYYASWQPACTSYDFADIEQHDTARTLPPSIHGSMDSDIGAVQLTLVFSVCPQKHSFRETQPTTTLPPAEYKGMLQCRDSTEHAATAEHKAIMSKVMLLQSNGSSHAQTELEDDHAGTSRSSKASVPSAAVSLLDLAIRSFIIGRPIRSPIARLVSTSTIETGLASLAPAAFSPGHVQVRLRQLHLSSLTRESS